MEMTCSHHPLTVCLVNPKLSRSSNAPRFHRSRCLARSLQVGIVSVDMVASFGET